MLPNLTNAVRAWTQGFTFDRVTKTIVDYQLTETLVRVSFRGVVAPLRQTDLEIKPEGQRQWRWLEIHSTTDLKLALDDLLQFKNVSYRVMSSHNWEDYGYWRYEIAESFEALVSANPLFIPLGSDRLITSDGLIFTLENI